MLFIKDLCKKLIEIALEIFIKVDNRKIMLFYHNYSGSNTVALYKLAPSEIKNYSMLTLLEDLTSNGTHDNFLIRLKRYLRRTIMGLSAKIIISTHGLLPKGKNTISLQAWHGFPLKAMGLMLKDSDFEFHRAFKKVDYILSYSNFYNVVLNSCSGTTRKKYIITGMPRNDFLFKSNGRDLLEEIISERLNKNEKVIFYLPTYREGYQRIDGVPITKNIFRFDYFSWEVFLDFLRSNKIRLVVKPHPAETTFLKLAGELPQEVIILTDEMLKNRGFDLYELLNAASVLITDYSSIYFDFLLLNRPIIFINSDSNIYKQKRGFLLEPYDFWAPGPKVNTYENLEKQILYAIKGNDYFQKQREIICDIIHYYKDGESAKRVWNYIDKLIKNVTAQPKK